MARYLASAEAFSKRASALLAAGNPADLLYCALELRLGIESRTQSYIHASDQISAQLKKGYHAGKLTAALRATHSDGRFVSVLNVRPEPPLVGCTFEFIPLSSLLISAYDKLGNYLHYKEKGPSFTAPWWEELRALLVPAVRDLAICARGTMLGVPLWRQSTNEMNLKLELPNADPRIETMKVLAESGQQHTIGVEYVPTEAFYDQAR